MSRLRADLDKDQGESMVFMPLGCCFANLNEEALIRLKLKFDICYVMVKQCLPLLNIPHYWSLSPTMEQNLPFTTSWIEQIFSSEDYQDQVEM